MRKTIEYSILGLYSVMLIVGLIFSFTVLILLSNVVAFVGFILVQNESLRKKPDERDLLISYKSSQLAFQIILIVLIFLSILLDFVDVLNYISFSNVISILVGLSFITFASNYVYYKGIH